MATYQQTLERTLQLYPMLYGDSEYLVLHHLFFVNGNGYEWINGELVDPFDEPDDKIYAGRARNRVRLWIEAESFDLEFMEQMANDERAELAAIGQRHLRRMTEIKKVRALAKRKGWAAAGKWLTEQDRLNYRSPYEGQKYPLYPLWKRSCICEIPDDIQQDWVFAAWRAIQWALSADVKRTASDLKFLKAARSRIQRLTLARDLVILYGDELP